MNGSKRKLAACSRHSEASQANERRRARCFWGRASCSKLAQVDTCGSNRDYRGFERLAESQEETVKTRIGGLCLSLATIGFSVVALIFVAQIVEIGGPAYAWEYIPPTVMLILGVGGTVWWVYRITVTMGTKG
jgi:hypothetical protein